MTCPDNLLDYYLLQAKLYYHNWYWIAEQQEGALEYNGWLIYWSKSMKPMGYYIKKGDIEILSEFEYEHPGIQEVLKMTAETMYMADQHDLSKV